MRAPFLPQERTMRKLHIKNLDYGVDADLLRQEFSKVGVVTDAIVIKDRETKRSRGFGFVEMQDDSDAQRAIQEMNGRLISSRPIVVSQARDRPRR